MLHEMSELGVDQPPHGFLLAVWTWNQAEIFEQTLQVDVWRSW